MEQSLHLAVARCGTVQLRCFRRRNTLRAESEYSYEKHPFTDSFRETRFPLQRTKVSVKNSTQGLA